MPTTDRPADLVSQGGQVTNSELCWNGPVWLCNPEMWPEKLVPVISKTSEEEAKVIRELLSLPSEKPELEWNVFDELLECHDLRRALHIQAWVQHFTTHRVHKGPLTSEDIQETKNWWIKRFLSQDSQKPHFEQTRQEINLVSNADRIFKCHGRI